MKVAWLQRAKDQNPEMRRVIDCFADLSHSFSEQVAQNTVDAGDPVWAETHDCHDTLLFTCGFMRMLRDRWSA